MRKGLTSTLMAVAVAILAMQAMAMAPVIKDIPSPVVGNAETVTPAMGFVYPDAIDLTKYVTDQESQSSQIIWSYEIVGTAKYKINNVPSMITGTDDPIHPGAKSLNNAVAGGEADFDHNPLTITIRNTNLSPTIGAPGNDVSTTPGILPSESQQVTFYASDETTFTVSKPVWFYSDNLENDHLSTGITQVYSWTAANGSTGFRYNLLAGSPTSSFGTTNGVCITTTAGANSKAAEWRSPFGTAAQSPLNLVKNAAYRIRLTITSSQTNNDMVPFFDIYIAQFDQIPPGGTTYYGQNYYGSNYFVYSAAASGGANGALSPSKDYIFWWTPPCVSTARWNDETTVTPAPGPFNAAMVDNKNAFIAFRILQDGVNIANQANALGTLCLQSFDVDRVDLGAMQSLSTVFEATTMTAQPSGIFMAPVSNGTAGFSGGKLTITPSSSSPTTLFGQVIPGDGVIDYLNQSATVDDYPCPMENQTLYLISMGLSAPTQNDMAHPPQMFWIGADTLTNELIELNWVSFMGYAYAMPAFTSADTPQPYKAFFYSNYGTLHGGQAQFAWWSIFRPRFMIGNGPNASETQVGAIRIHNMKVEKVTF